MGLIATVGISPSYAYWDKTEYPAIQGTIPLENEEIDSSLAQITLVDAMTIAENEISDSVKWKIISRLRNELGLKDRDEHHLYSDAADRLHLMSCGSQNSTEVRQALQECDRTRTRALQPEPAPKKNWILFSTDYLD